MLVEGEIDGADLAAERLYLREILLSEGDVDGLGAFGGIGLPGEEHVDGSALELVGYLFPYAHLLVLGEQGSLDVDVGVLSVHGAELHRKLSVFKQGLGLAVAGHRSYHAEMLIISVQKYEYIN